MKGIPFSWLLAAAGGFLNLCLADQDSSINVAVRASFGSAPYLIELLETAALENSTSYYPLLDRVAEGTFAELSTDRELYTRFVEVLQQDGHFKSQDSLSSFNFALALRAAAPRVEAHFQFYKTSVEPGMMAAQDAACPVWVFMDGQQYCSPDLERAQQPVTTDRPDEILPFDRVLGLDGADVSTILYADITHPLFGQFHQAVSQTAKDGKASYRVRYRPSEDKTGSPLFVNGYGVELALKRTDYIVIDDREAAKSDGASSQDQKQMQDQEQDKPASDIKPLTTSELANLGVNAASYIMSSANPMEALLNVTADFPRFSGFVASKNASQDYLTEHAANRGVLPAGMNVLWMNGLQIQPREINAFSLLDILRGERHLIGRMQDIGLTPSQAVDLLSHDNLAQAMADDQPQRYDWTTNSEDESVVIWLNDLELDKRYAGWSPSLTSLLQRTYPGQLPQVRRDIHNLVVPVDLHNIRDLDLIVNTLQNLVKRNVPIRIGLVPAGQGAESVDVAKMSYHLLDTYGISALLSFYQNVVTSKKGVADVESAFATTVQDQEPKNGWQVLGYPEVLKGDSTKNKVTALQAYRNRLALNEKVVPFFINGVVSPRSETWFEFMSQRVYMDHRALQVAVYEGTITDDRWAPQFFLDGASSRRNPLIIPEDVKDVQVVDVASITSEFSSLFSKLPTLVGSESSLLSEQSHILLVVDLDSKEGQSLLLEALKFHASHSEAELTILHNPKLDEALSKISAQLFKLVTNGGRDIKPELLTDLLDDEKTRDQPSIKTQEDAVEYWMSYDTLVERIGVQKGESALWLNGRLLNPIRDPLLVADFETLLTFERRSRIAPVTTAITALDLEDKFKSPLDLAKVTSTVARSLKSTIPEGIYESAPPARTGRFKVLKSEHTAIHLESSPQPAIQLVVSLDPASETAQSWVPMLKTLSELHGVSVKLFLNPKENLSELPVKRFFRQVVSSAPSFHSNGSLAVSQATFSGIPEDTLFNLGMVVPPSWLVSPMDSIYDPENIKLSTVPAGRDINAIFELEHILIEGHSRDVTKNIAPRGVQLLLGTAEHPHFTDTIIMANLGYFQFKANPGHWQISLKPGRSSKIFNIDTLGSQGQNGNSQPDDQDPSTSVTLMSFQGATLFPRLSRKPGMEDEDVLETVSSTASPAAAVAAIGDVANKYLKLGSSFASSALSSLGLKTASSALSSKSTTNADINIFSVASGHLYERMLNIMMLSVMKHTTHSVKFWFIEQFLSPSFKASLPHLSAHYNFRYEMVTYKWPHWLRGQREKQREIWGYKILFLDVLFPVDLDKVIFVDADQIVRTDMQLLNEVDLRGAPYGFTPMCDSRTEMEGFRFWKQGYWANFLEGKPYHISALYVVDLKRFRELAAGDRLRQQYHALSADPASLSNLDQDLPNHMQHNLPIHSLDQDWLWCETWCSDASLTNAKTIDLCNNPMTKEPKLDRARRQVPEWSVYDEEIAGVLKAATADVDVDGNTDANVNVNANVTSQTQRKGPTTGEQAAVLNGKGKKDEL